MRIVAHSTLKAYYEAHPEMEETRFVESEISTWSESDCRRLLAEVDSVFQAKRDTPEGGRLDTLADLIEAYEDVHYVMREPSPEAVEKYERDKSGVFAAA